MTVIGDERMQLIKEIVCEILEIDPAEMTPISRFKEDHDADSLRAIEILASLEKTFGITIDQSELASMSNLNGIYEVVAAATTSTEGTTTPS